MKLKSSRASRSLKTLPKELKVLLVVLKPGTTIDMVRSSCWQVSTKAMQATCWGIFFFWKYETQEKIALERNMNHGPWALIYRNGLRRYFLERKDGESFDIGEPEDLKKKLVAKKKQLKAERKGNRPHRAAPLDENQLEKLWTTGAFGLKTPVASSHVEERHHNVRYERPTRTPQLQSPRIQRPRKPPWLHWALDENENRRNGWPKSKTQVQQIDISGKQRWKRSLCCIKKVPQPQTRGKRDEFYFQPIYSPKENICYKKLPMKRDGMANIMNRMA